jgi:hypothetical protein
VAIARLPSGQHTADLGSCTIQQRAVAEQKTEFLGIFIFRMDRLGRPWKGHPFDPEHVLLSQDVTHLVEAI